MPEFRITDLLKSKKESLANGEHSTEKRFRISDLRKSYNKRENQESQKNKSDLKPSKKEPYPSTFRITDLLPALEKHPESKASQSKSMEPKSPKPYVKPSSLPPSMQSHEIGRKKNPALLVRPPHQQQNKMVMKDVYNIAIRYRWIMMSVPLIFSLLRVLPLIHQTQPYIANAKIIYEAQSSQFDMKNGVAPIVLYADTVLRLAFTSKILEETFRLFRSNQISPTTDRIDELKEEMKRITKNNIGQFLQLKPLGNNKDVIDATALSMVHPQTSVYLVNSFSQAIMEGLQSFITKEYDTQLQELEKSIQLNKSNLKKAENELYLLLDPEEGLKLSTSNAKIIEKIEQLRLRKNEQLLRLQEIEGLITSYRKDLGIKGNIEVKDIRWIDPTSKLYQQWKGLEFEQQQIKSTHQPNSPQVIKINQEAQKIKEILFPEDSKHVIYLEAIGMTQHRVQELKGYLSSKQIQENEIAALTKQILDSSEKIVASSEEQSQINKIGSRMEYLEIFRQKLHESKRHISILKISAQTGYSVMQWADHAIQREKPNWISRFFQGALGGLILSTGVVFMLYKFENTPKHSIDLARKLPLKVLGVTPKWKSNEKILSHLDLMDSTKGDMYSIIRNNIRFSHSHQGDVAIFITSPLQNDGKSLTAINLAISYALEKESVILLSSDLRTTNSLTNLITNQEKKYGICEYLQNENLSIEECIHSSEFESLDVMPTFGTLNNPTRYLTGERFADLVRSLKKRYSVVLVDAPAVLPIIDTCTFIHLSDVVVVVAQAYKTTFKEINLCLARFKHSGITPNGIILNGVQDMASESFYGAEFKNS